MRHLAALVAATSVSAARGQSPALPAPTPDPSALPPHPPTPRPSPAPARLDALVAEAVVDDPLVETELETFRAGNATGSSGSSDGADAAAVGGGIGAVLAVLLIAVLYFYRVKLGLVDPPDPEPYKRELPEEEVGSLFAEPADEERGLFENSTFGAKPEAFEPAPSDPLAPAEEAKDKEAPPETQESAFLSVAFNEREEPSDEARRIAQLEGTLKKPHAARAAAKGDDAPDAGACTFACYDAECHCAPPPELLCEAPPPPKKPEVAPRQEIAPSPAPAARRPPRRSSPRRSPEDRSGFGGGPTAAEQRYGAPSELRCGQGGGPMAAEHAYGAPSEAPPKNASPLEAGLWRKIAALSTARGAAAPRRSPELRSGQGGGPTVAEQLYGAPSEAPPPAAEDRAGSDWETDLWGAPLRSYDSSSDDDASVARHASAAMAGAGSAGTKPPPPPARRSGRGLLHSMLRRPWLKKSHSTRRRAEDLEAHKRAAAVERVEETRGGGLCAFDLNMTECQISCEAPLDLVSCEAPLDLGCEAPGEDERVLNYDGADYDELIMERYAATKPPPLPTQTGVPVAKPQAAVAASPWALGASPYRSGHGGVTAASPLSRLTVAEMARRAGCVGRAEASDVTDSEEEAPVEYEVPPPPGVRDWLPIRPPAAKRHNKRG